MQLVVLSDDSLVLLAQGDEEGLVAGELLGEGGEGELELGGGVSGGQEVGEETLDQG